MPFIGLHEDNDIYSLSKQENLRLCKITNKRKTNNITIYLIFDFTIDKTSISESSFLNI